MQFFTKEGVFMRTDINASPQWITYGTADSSMREIPRPRSEGPQHLPKVFLWTAKGSTYEQVVGYSTRNQVYGQETFNELGKYATHQTVLANVLTKKYNQMMVKRLLPPDAGPKANLTLWLDVLPCTVNIFERDDYGRIKLNNLNAPIVVNTANGYRVKWVVTRESVVANALNNIGKRVPVTGDQVDGNITSTRYPIIELAADSQGEFGNNLGIHIWPFGGTITDSPNAIMIKSRCYPYYFNIIERENTRSSPKIKTTIFGERNVTFSFKPGSTDPTSSRQLGFATVLDQAYSDIQTEGFDPIYSPFGDVIIYNEIIANLLEDFHAAEIPFIDDNCDFTDEITDKYLFNFIGGFNSNGSPYHSFQFTDDPNNAIRFSEYTNIFLGGGSDGTMSEENYHQAVKEQLQRYTDINDEIQELSIHNESTIYDTGFPLDIKEYICDAIMLRPDINVHLTTFVHNEPELSLIDQYNLGIALRTRLDMLPESEYFGTDVMRAFISTDSMRLRDSKWPYRVTALLDLAAKNADRMGSPDGIWRSDTNPTREGRKEVKIGYDIKTPYIPPHVAARRWDIGLNTLRPNGRNAWIWPAYKTAHSNDTSVLINYPAMTAICHIQKLLYRTWAAFTGRDDLSPEELTVEVNAYFSGLVSGIYAGEYIVIPRAHFTTLDELKGYRFTMPIDFGADNMVTVMASWVRAFRRKDLLEG